MRWIALLLITALLAGCTDDGAGEEPVEPDAPDEPAAPEEPGPTPPEDPANTPPELVLGTSATAGPAPLNVTISINGTDADDDALSWTLDLDGDGEADETGDGVPFSTTITLEVGDHTIRATLSDGTDTVSDSVTINVTAVDEGLVYEGTVAEDCQQQCGGVCDPVLYCYAATGAAACDSFRDGEPGGDCIWFELPPETVGQPFVISSTGGDPDAEFRKSCAFDETDPEAQAGTVAFGDHMTASSGEETGTVPADLPCVVIWEWNTDAPSDIRMVIG